MKNRSIRSEFAELMWVSCREEAEEKADQAEFASEEKDEAFTTPFLTIRIDQRTLFAKSIDVVIYGCPLGAACLTVGTATQRR